MGTHWAVPRMPNCRRLRHAAPWAPKAPKKEEWAMRRFHPTTTAVLACLALIIASPGVNSTLSLAAAPNNDNIADATALPPSTFSEGLNTAEATVESNEPSDCFTPTHSVWYRFDSGNDFYNLAADFSGTDYPWQTAYYTGAPGALQLRMCFPEPSISFFGSVPGETWYIQISGRLGTATSEYGNLVFNWTATRTVPIDVSLTLNPMGSVNRTGDMVHIAGTVSCSRPGPVHVSVSITQVFAGRLVATAGGSSDVVECDDAVRPWSVTLTNGGPIRFGPGIATADASATMCDEQGCGGAQVAGRVRLKRG